MGMIRKTILILIILFTTACAQEEVIIPPLDIPVSRQGDTYTRPADRMVMLFVAGGSFMMGNDAYIQGLEVSTAPEHEVTLSSYMIDKYPITNLLYAKCVNAGVCAPPRVNGSWTREEYFTDPAFAHFPVININWYDAQTYCQWAGVKLPTEAQWEYAARGPKNWIYPWGSSNPTRKNANWSQLVGDTTQVDKYPEGVSWVGVFDLAGNTWEWTSDWLGRYPGTSVHNPTGPENGRKKVARGGSFINGGNSIRSINRNPVDPDFDTNPFFGFRCAADLVE